MSAPLPTHYQFSGHETFPLRQLWLRKAYIAVNDAGGSATSAINTKDVFAPEIGIRKFGVGKNMVAAIRHWALACDVLKEESGNQLSPGTIGDVLLAQCGGLDPYFEKPATPWLIHWLLAARALRSTTWWWVFNRVTTQTFNTESVTDALYAAAKESGTRASRVTVKRDVEVCMRCYLPRRDGREADDATEPLLADLGLLSEPNVGRFQFRRGAQKSLPDGLFGYALLEYWDAKAKAVGARTATLSFEAIAHDYGAPGRVFKLDEHSVGERLTTLEEITGGQLAWSDSAGIRQISQKLSDTPDDLKRLLLQHAYGN